MRAKCPRCWTGTCAARPTIARSSGRCSCSSSGRPPTAEHDPAAARRRRRRFPALLLAARAGRLTGHGRDVRRAGARDGHHGGLGDAPHDRRAVPHQATAHVLALRGAVHPHRTDRARSPLAGARRARNGRGDRRPRRALVRRSRGDRRGADPRHQRRLLRRVAAAPRGHGARARHHARALLLRSAATRRRAPHGRRLLGEHRARGARQGVPRPRASGGNHRRDGGREGILRPRTLVARLQALHAPLGIAVLIVVAGPWHLLAALHNPGFLWDYTVNQHVLFFFDEKLPRDSIPDSLGFFLAMFLTRGLPWSLLLPAAGLWAYRTMRDDPVRAPAVGLIAAWVAVVLGFFALAPSRLEHYSLPALPATALVVGALLTDARSRVSRGWLVGPLAAGAALALGVMFLPPRRLISGIEPTLTGRRLDTLAPP